MVQREEKLASKTIFEGKVIRVYHDDVRLPSGKTSKREVVRHHGGVTVAALDGDEIYLVNQYRYAYDEQLLELPAGKLEMGEDPAECGRRELSEEVGLEAKELKSLGVMYPTVGY